MADDVLERHKLAEIAKHPPSRMWRYPGLFQLTGIFLTVVTLASLITCFTMWVEVAHDTAPIEAALVVTFATALSVLFMVKCNLATSLKAPARWIEGYCAKRHRSHFLYPFNVPNEISSIAARIFAEDRDVSFIVGTLYQRKIELDPYLLVEKTDPLTGQCSRACLGVWDGDEIIHLAKV